MPFVRQAVAADLPALQVFDQMYEATAGAIKAGTCIVAGIDGVVLAYAIVGRSFFARRFVEFVFVHPDHRQKGLANALLGFAEVQFPKEALWISVSVGNQPMQTVLHRRGYKCSGMLHDLANVPELIFHKRPA